MANIKLKSTDDIESWNTKELRKLRITIKNRMESLKTNNKPKELPESHPLNGMELDNCQRLLDKVIKAEKKLG